jgi:hypothetical protein
MCASCGNPGIIHGNNRGTSEGGHGEGDRQRPPITPPREEAGTEQDTQPE